VNRRQLVRSGVLGGLGLLAAPMINLGRVRLYAQGPVVLATRAVDLVLGSTVVDMLALFTLDWPKLFDWHRHPERFGEADFRRLEASAVNVFHPAVETSARDAREGALRWTHGWNRLLGGRECFLVRVDSTATLDHAPRVGKLGVIVGFQNSNHFATVADVAAFHRLGQRVSQLTYNTRNRLGCGCYERRDGGLTPFGAEVVAEMNRLGMAVDLSHCGERTSRDAIAASRYPALVTHANCRALVPGQPRCKSDDTIRRLARSGGVMGITVVRAFVARTRTPTIEHVLDHFDHVARIAGIEHVGLGSDVDTAALDPRTGRTRDFYAIRGLDLRARVFQIAEGLLRRGHREADVRGVLGGNFLRVLHAVLPRAALASVPEGERERDPFCPAPHRTGPLGGR
jgi:membrane dipeptidase